MSSRDRYRQWYGMVRNAVFGIRSMYSRPVIGVIGTPGQGLLGS